MQSLITIVLGASAYGTAPSGPPTNVITTLYAGSKVRVDFTITDSLAQSLVYENFGATASTRLAPGVSFWETGLTVADLSCLSVSHYRGGQETVKVESTGVVTC